MPFDAVDLAVFVDPSMPGYVRATVGGVPVDGLFKSPYAEALGIGGSSPTLTVLPDVVVADNAVVVVDGQSYAAVDVKASRGLKLLVLEAM